MQVQLPATAKASTLEAGADVKKNGLFSGAGHLEDGGTHVLKPVYWIDGGLVSQSPSIPRGGEDFYEEGEGNRTKRLRKGVENLYM